VSKDASEAKTYLLYDEGAGIVTVNGQFSVALKFVGTPDAPEPGVTEQPDTVYTKAVPPGGVAIRIGWMTVCCCPWAEEAARVRIMTAIASTRSMKTGVFIVGDPPTYSAHQGALAQLC
jgi:hypothetical protein